MAVSPPVIQTGETKELSTLNDPHRGRVKLVCRLGHEHEMCRTVIRGLPPELRGEPQAAPGFGGGGGGCPVLSDIDARGENELGRNLQENKAADSWLSQSRSRTAQLTCHRCGS